MKVSINETTLTNIGAAIREKTGKTDLIAPGDMPAEIRAIESGGGGGELPRVVETEDVDYFFANDHFNWYLDLVPSFTLKIKDNNNINSLFQDCSKEMPMSKVIVIGKGIAGLTGTFLRANSITELPEFRINNTQRSETADISLGNFFMNCNYLVEIPEDFWRNKDENGNLLDGYWTNGEYYTLNGTFNGCYSLRKLFLPLKPGGSVVSSFNATNTFYCCYALESIKYPVAVNVATNPVRTNTFQKCGRLKSLTFQTENDNGVAPLKTKWNNVTVDLSSNIGYVSSTSDITNYSKYHGLTLATLVNADCYEELKNNPDYWTTSYNYSLYNKNSAWETILSLPDVTSSGKNSTIKFKGESGAKTDGGAINTLPADIIGIAADRGWTVTFV